MRSRGRGGQEKLLALHITVAEVKNRPLHHHHHHPLQLGCHHCLLPWRCLLSAVAHCHCFSAATIPPSIALHLPLPIKIVLPPSQSPIAAITVHGNCHCNCTAIPSSIAPPPLSTIAIVLPLLPSPIVTPCITHCHHHYQSQSCRHTTNHGAVAAVTHHDCAAIVQPCVPS
jgi:hypothetical protein